MEIASLHPDGKNYLSSACLAVHRLLEYFGCYFFDLFDRLITIANYLIVYFIFPVL